MTEARPTVVRERLDHTEAAAVRTLVERARAEDGVRALNEQALLRVAHQDGRIRHVLGHDGDRSVAYALLDRSEAGAGMTAEAVVDPADRRTGWGTAVVRRAVAEADGVPLLVWSHGDHPGATRLSERLGFRRVRDLWQLRRQLGGDAAAVPAVRLPAGVTVRSFEPGKDEEEWLALNARAFADHPEQGAMDAGDLAARLGSGWFDPAGFFLAERSGPDGARLVGFHWTKVHPGQVGEVYVVGVHPDEQGSGLGTALTLAGLHHLAERGVRSVHLYVEADNAPAVRIYQRLGFAHVGTDAQYRHPGSR